MSVVSNIHPLLGRLLPERIVPLATHAGRKRLFGGVGMPSQRVMLGGRFTLAERLDEAADIPAIYAELRRQALAGHATALNDLGWVWLNGKYWHAEPQLAGRLLRMAALQGSAAAWFNLGQQHYFGKGVEVSYSQAAYFYQRAFEHGIDHAAATLGDLFEEEVCDSAVAWQIDQHEAYRWFLQGAQRGEARCRFEVGHRLLHGLYVEADVLAALSWLELAAGAGVMQAAEELAVHYGESDEVRYVHWRDQAILLGSDLAWSMKLKDQIRR